jgi:hypothetical protein
MMHVAVTEATVFLQLKEIYTGGYQGCQGGNQAKKSSTGNAHSVQLPPED